MLRVACGLLAWALIFGAGLRAEPVRLQLKWRHQFQFAGYYAAAARGYYEEAGLEVEIIEGNSGRSPIASVTSGAAEFGVGDTDVLLHRLRGEPLVVCAAIFQHSPYIMLSRADRGIRSPHDLVGARVMMAEGQGASQFLAMLAREGVEPRRVNLLPHSWNLTDLVEGRVDAISAYATVEPGRLRELGVTPAILRSLDYGVDFYGDTLFTTRALAGRDKGRVRAFVRASLRGWEHAMDHPDEVIEHILALPGVTERGVTRETLRAEANAMRAFVLPDIVQIGHMNQGRWRAIAKVFSEQDPGLGEVPDDFMLATDESRPSGALSRRFAMLSGIVGAGAALVLGWNLQIRCGVNTRTRELREEVARREQAERDLRRGKERLKMGQAVGQMGDWSHDLATGRIEWSDTLFHLYGRDPALGQPSLEEVLGYYSPKDAARLADRIRDATEKNEGYDLDLRLRTADGHETCHHAIGRVECDENGRAVRLHGIVQDITARKLAEERVRAQLRELERWREATLGREERVQALKAEVNELLATAGHPARYAAPGVIVSPTDARVPILSA